MRWNLMMLAGTLVVTAGCGMEGYPTAPTDEVRPHRQSMLTETLWNPQVGLNTTIAWPVSTEWAWGVEVTWDDAVLFGEVGLALKVREDLAEEGAEGSGTVHVDIIRKIPGEAPVVSTATILVPFARGSEWRGTVSFNPPIMVPYQRYFIGVRIRPEPETWAAFPSWEELGIHVLHTSSWQYEWETDLPARNGPNGFTVHGSAYYHGGSDYLLGGEVVSHHPAMVLIGRPWVEEGGEGEWDGRTVCHKDRKGTKTMVITKPKELKAHLDHGDRRGAC